MDRSNLPGLSPLWLILLGLILGVFLATALPVVVLSKEILPADWLGFAGGIIGAGCTIFAGWLSERPCKSKHSALPGSVEKWATTTFLDFCFDGGQPMENSWLTIGTANRTSRSKILERQLHQPAKFQI
jgi:hypothetical protein